jgi:hypothetical protein
VRRRTLGAAAVVLVAPLLGGCALNAGSAANEEFAEHMEGVEGFVEADADVSNTFPFAGTGTADLWIDASAPVETLVEGVEHAMSFSPGFGVNAKITDVYLSTGWGVPAAPEDDFSSSASIKLEWGTPPAPAIDSLLALRQMPEIRGVAVRSPGYVELSVLAGADACAVADRVEEIVGVAPGTIDRIDVAAGDAVERSTCGVA